MISGFEIETAPLTDAEKKLVPIIIKGLSNHEGSKNAIHGKKICRQVSAKYSKLTEPRLRKIINFIRASRILPVMATSKGYFISHNTEQIKLQVQSLQERKESIEAAIKGLQSFIH